MRNSKFLMALVLTTAYCLLPTASVLADSGITISPAVQQVTIAADQPQTSFDISLTNHSSQPQTLNVTTVDFGALADTGGLYFIGQSNDFERKYGLADWLVVPQRQVTLGPQSEQKLTVTIDNRSTLTPGGHYAAVLFKSAPPAGTPTSAQVDVNPVVTELVFARKTGGEVQGLQLAGIKRPGWWGGLPKQLTLDFRNTGNVHVVPRGLVSVVDPLGRTVAKGVINEDSRVILPESRLLLNVSLTSRSAALVSGQYRIVADYRFDGKDDFNRLTAGFYNVPSLLSLFGLLLVLAALVWLALRIRRRRK